MKIRMLYSKKKDGNMSFKYGEYEEVKNNREKWFKKNNINNHICIKATNTNDKFILTKESLKDINDNTINTDCVITKLPNIFLQLNFGDCIPCVIFDEKENIMALLHLGWQGVTYKLADLVLEKMIKEYDCNPKNIVVILGPSTKNGSLISINPLQKTLKDWDKYLTLIENDKYYVDLDGYLRHDLEKWNVKRIYNSNIDTCTNLEMFSCNRSNNSKEKQGRFICGAMIIE